MKVRLAGGQLSPPFVFALTLLDTLLLVGLILFFMRAHREPVREQLFGTRRKGPEMLLGLLLIPASFLVAAGVATPRTGCVRQVAARGGTSLGAG